jgi:hypothetical protein
MNTTIKHYALNKAYTVEEFDALNYALNDQEIVIKLDLYDYNKNFGKHLDAVQNETKQTVLTIRKKTDLEFELLNDDIEKFLHDFEHSNIEHFKDLKFHSTYIMGNHPISVAGSFVLHYLVSVDFGLGSSYVNSYPFSLNQDIVLEMKNYPQDVQFILNLYEKMIPYVAQVNQHIQNGIEFIEAINLVETSLETFIASESLDASIMKKLSDLK